MDEKKYKLICVRKGKTNYARTNNRKNVTLGSYNYHYYFFNQNYNKIIERDQLSPAWFEH